MITKGEAFKMWIWLCEWHFCYTEQILRPGLKRRKSSSHETETDGSDWSKRKVMGRKEKWIDGNLIEVERKKMRMMLVKGKWREGNLKDYSVICKLCFDSSIDL